MRYMTVFGIVPYHVTSGLGRITGRKRYGYIHRSLALLSLRLAIWQHTEVVLPIKWVLNSLAFSVCIRNLHATRLWCTAHHSLHLRVQLRPQAAWTETCS